VSDQRKFEQFQKDLEARERAFLLEYSRCDGHGVDAFLWMGDPQAKPIQRIGLILSACIFLLLVICLSFFVFQSHFENGSVVALLVCIALTLLSARLIRNAFLRNKRQESNVDRRKDD
jgi:hypothetical protein